MITVMANDCEFTVPDSVQDLQSFLEWRRSDTVPERGRFWWLEDRVWADFSMEELFSHGTLKAEFTRAITTLLLENDAGVFFPDGALIANVAAKISGEPDGVFVSHTAEDSGAVEFIEGSREGFTEIHGSPDMVLEIVSYSSVRKDNEVLREAYWKAGIKEYWLADVRKGELQFDILKYDAEGYSEADKQDGWIQSDVFGRSFRLTEFRDARDRRRYKVEVR